MTPSKRKESEFLSILLYVVIRVVLIAKYSIEEIAIILIIIIIKLPLRVIKFLLYA